MPLTFTLDPLDGASAIDDVTPVVSGTDYGTDYAGLDPVIGGSAVSVVVRMPRTFTLDPIDGVTTVSFKVTPDLGDAIPVSMGLLIRAHAILLPPVVEA